MKSHNLVAGVNYMVTDLKTDNYTGKMYYIVCFGSDSKGNKIDYIIDDINQLPKDVRYYPLEDRVYNPYPLMDNGDFIEQFIKSFFNIK